MPIPTPTPSEQREEFMDRCMSDETMQREYPDEKQRAAVCHRQYQEKSED